MLRARPTVPQEDTVAEFGPSTAFGTVAYPYVNHHFPVDTRNK
jgi:hypothetical protein